MDTMKRIVTLILILAPLLISAQKGYQYEYVLKVSGIEDSRTMKLAYQAIHDMDNNAQISFNDDFSEIKVRSNLRFEKADFVKALEPLNIDVLNLGSSRTLDSDQEQNSNSAILKNDQDH